MDWVPTLLAAAGAQANPAYPLDGMNLLPILTQEGVPTARRLYWCYKAHSQRAMRDGDMKWLKIGDDTFLFNDMEDPLERANLKNRQPEVYSRLVAEFKAWNATMLPESPGTNSDGFSAKELADHIGVGME